MYKADLITGDFSENTMTFEIDGKMTLQAGTYFILTEKEFKELNAEYACEDKCDFKHVHTNWYKCDVCGSIEAR